MDPAHLTDLQLDALREVTNIGCGAAATALSQLLDGRRVGLEVTRSAVLQASDLDRHLNGLDHELWGVELSLHGGIEGLLVLVYPEPQARELAEILAGSRADPDKRGVEESALMEVGNIVASAYLNAVGAVTGLMMLPSVPKLVRGRADDVAHQVHGEVPRSDRLLLLETWMRATGARDLNGHLLILPEPGSIDVLLEALGL